MASPSRESRRLQFGPFEVEPSTGRLLKGGIPIKLPPQPFKVLVLLLTHSGEVVGREKIRQHLWGDSTFVDFERGINFSINQIRAALCDDADKPRYIETLPKIGYRFLVPVQDGGGDGLHKTNAVSPTQLYERPRKDAATVSTPSSRDEDHSFNWIVLGERKYTFATVAGAVMLLVAAIMFAAIKWFSGSRVSEFSNVQITKLTDSGRARDAAISIDGKYVSYSLWDGKGESLHLVHAQNQSDIEVVPSGSGFHGVTFSPDGSQIYFVRADERDPFFKYLYSVPVLGGKIRKLISDVDSPVSFSPGGRQFVYVHCLQPKNDIELKIAEIDGSGEHLLATVHEASGFLFQPGPSWSPDGQTIAVPALGIGKEPSWTIYLVSVKDGTVRKLYERPDEIGRPAWLPDSRTLVFPSYDRDVRRRQLWTISLPTANLRQLTHDLTDYGDELTITRDGRVIAATTETTISNVWRLPAANMTKAEQITFSEIPTFDVSEAFDGKLLTLGADGVPWVMNSDGSQRARFADLTYVSLVIPCGNFVVLKLNGPTNPALVRANRDGSHVTQLATGNLWSPVCSADGRFVFYATTQQPQTIWRVPVDLGKAEELTEVQGTQLTGLLAVSPDGKFLAYPHTQYGHVPPDGWGVAVISATGGKTIRNLTLPTAVEDLHWSPDGRGLQYTLTMSGATNIWEQSLLTGKPKQLTKFTSGQIFGFNWSSDRQHLYLTRGDVSSDVVLMSNLH